MAEILSFPQEVGRREPDLQASKTDAPAKPKHGAAEIVIFPGVRIERHEFSLADRLTPPRSKRSNGGDGKPRHKRG